MGLSHRRGFTVSELLAAIAIVSLLLSLLLPTLGFARATARRTKCANNLKQIGVACSNNESQTGHLIGRDLKDTEMADSGVTSGLHGTVADYGEAGSSAAGEGQLSRNPLMTCPSDDSVRSGLHSQNYMANNGLPHLSRLPWVSHLGVLSRPQSGSSIATRQIVDGLSSTALASERLTVLLPPAEHEATPENLAFFVAQTSRQPLRTLWHVEGIELEGMAMRREFETLCRSLKYSDASQTPQTRDEQFGFKGGGKYTHALTPNSPSCFWVNSSGVLSGVRNIVTANSRHPDIANVLFCDGRVVPVAARVDPSIWQAIGTSSGSEPVSSF